MSLSPAVEDMFSMEEFLSAEQAKELVRFSTIFVAVSTFTFSNALNMSADEVKK